MEAQSDAVGKLYVVATPIGNLSDITLRALEVLKSVQLVAAEDTRVTATLLRHYGVDTRMLSLHSHNEHEATPKVLAMLRQGQSVALVSDAGTPAISDPGAILVKEVWAAGFEVIPIPGPNAAITALSAAGIAATGFLFYGFLPPRPVARRTVLEKLKAQPYSLVFYEAPHRIVELVEDLVAVFGNERGLVLARELTKRFESIHRCSLGEAPAWLAGDPDRQRGEFVVIVSGNPQVQTADETETRRVLEVLLEELPVKRAAALAAHIVGRRKNELYELALTLKKYLEPVGLVSRMPFEPQPEGRTSFWAHCGVAKRLLCTTQRRALRLALHPKTRFAHTRNKSDRLLGQGDGKGIRSSRQSSTADSARLRQGSPIYTTPASITNDCDVAMRLSSAASQRIIAAMSCGASFSLRHCRCSRFASAAGVLHSVSCRSVNTQPGSTQLTRILNCPRSRAKARVKPSTAALAATYTGIPPLPWRQLVDPILIIDPPPRRFMPSITACAAKN
jgi:16S rRNA (cytidine1402-2'-O)-methyltransferase